MNVWILLTFALVLAGIGIAVRWEKKRQILAALKSRRNLTDDEIYEQYYASSSLGKAIVLELWHEVADALRTPAGFMRPTDRFGKEVGAYWITSEELDVLGVAARQRANRQGIAIDMKLIRTIDDYVRQLARGNNQD
jgi:hypothetical protein